VGLERGIIFHLPHHHLLVGNRRLPSTHSLVIYTGKKSEFAMRRRGKTREDFLASEDEEIERKKEKN
jgi:hypothetical protein